MDATTPALSSADPSSVRRWNERVVLTALADGRAVRAAELARATGLTTASVRDVLRTLGAKGWVSDMEPVQGGMGRPARTFRLARPDALTLGVDLGGHTVRVVSSDVVGTVTTLGEAAVPPGDLAGTKRVLAELLSGVDPARVWTTGLAVSGAMDADGRLLRSIALPHLVGARPDEVFADVLHGDVLVTHDSKSALWAEHRQGAAVGARDVMLVSLGRHPTIALLLDGRLYKGAHGSAGELSLNELLPATDGYRWDADADSPDPQGAALRSALASDAASIEGALAFLHGITPQIAYAVALVDPSLLVVGGALAPALERGLPRFAEELGSRLQSPPTVRLSTLDQYAAATGACHLARERLWHLLLDHADGVAPLTRAAFDAAATA